ncbi:dopamine receptor 2-like [Acanthaster planci]|uniref:Dopamine receptor 2-like n=1 Tax=Acanthaster planci TaxID=133434 RepID=A0A8B7ZY29_ACAPL|nr:dopamine receptor 2-like [Acanthaster planci]
MAGPPSTAPPWVSTGSQGTWASWTRNLAYTSAEYITDITVDSTTTSSPSTTYIQRITSDSTGASWSTVEHQQSAVAFITQSEFLTGSTAISKAYTTDDARIASVSSAASGIYDSGTTTDRFQTTTMMDSTSFISTTWLNNSASMVDIVTREPPVEDTLAKDVIVGSLLSVLGLLTVFGNTLVILAIYRERCLRTVTNLFIASLASADFIIGTTVIPFAIYNELRFGEWVFGKSWCDLWHAIDILACTASITNLCVIAVDRYWAITRPMSYPSRMTKKLGIFLIACVWICSSLISFPCIAWWQAVEPPDRPDTDCVFPEDATYLIISSCISFYIPSTLMIFMYAQVYRTAVEQVKVIKSGQRKVNAGSHHQGAMSMRVHRGGTVNNHHSAGYTNGYNARNVGMTGGIHGGAKNAVNNARRSLLAGMNREHKAARTLGIVMGVFIMCWLPFFIVNVMAPVCPDCIVNPHITFPVVTWLGYANSALNPAIYAFASRKFKRAFIKIICDCLPRRYQPDKWERRRRPRRTMSMSNMEPDSSYTMVEYGETLVRPADRKVDSSTAILSGGRPHLYSLRQTYF